MKKILSLLISTVLLTSIFAGCGTKGSTGEGTSKENPNSNPKEVSKTVTVYSPHPTDIINPIIKEFQDKTGITVDLVAAGTGELLKRIEAESSNPMGDVMWGGGAESIDAYKKYLEPYNSPEAAAIFPQYKEKGNLWIGFDALPMVIMYNKKLVKEDEAPKAWADLLNPKWKGKIAYADPAKSGSSYTILCTMLTAYGKDDSKAWDFVKKFVANLDGKVLSSSSGVFKGVADGEYSIGLTLEEAAMKYVKAGADVGVVYPSEGTSAVPDATGIIKGAKNMENAKKFVDFVSGKETQSVMANTMFRRSVRTDISDPQGFKPMKDIKLVDYDFNWAAENKNDIMSKWKGIIVGK